MVSNINEFDSSDFIDWVPTSNQDRVFETLTRGPTMKDIFITDFEERIPRLIETPPSSILLHVYTPPSRYNYGEIGEGESIGEMNPILNNKEKNEGDYVIKALFDYLNDLSKNGKQLPTILIAGGHPALHGGYDTCELYAKRILELQKRTGIEFQVISETGIRNADPNYNPEATDTRGELRFLDYMSKNYPDLTGENLLCLGRLPHMARIRLLLEGNRINAETINIESLIVHYHQSAFMRLQNRPRTTATSGLQSTIENLTEFRKRELLFQLFVRSVDYNGAIMEWLSKRMGSKRKMRAMSMLESK